MRQMVCCATSIQSRTCVSSLKPLRKMGGEQWQQKPGQMSRQCTSSRVCPNFLPSIGRNSFYMGTCQDEPEQLDDWNRIAELQQRNRVCPPHLKTCYPLESRVRCEVTSRPPTLTLVSSLNIYPGFLVYWEGYFHVSTWNSWQLSLKCEVRYDCA